MKLNSKTTLILSTLFAAATLSACGQAPIPTQMQQPIRFQAQTQPQAARQVLVRFRSQIQMSSSRVAEFNAKYGLRIREYLPALNVYVVDIDTDLGIRADKVVTFLQNDPMVEHAELNYSVQVQPVATDMQIMPVRK